MGIFIDMNKCNGCKGLEEPLCVKVCPGDLLSIDPSTQKARICAERDCWDDMACVKICPRDAISTVLPYSLACYKATLRPKLTRGQIQWTLTDLDGKEQTFVIKRKEE